VLSILAFAALTNALGGALEEFWPVFGTKAGMAKASIALFVGAQNAVEAVSAILAHRLSGLANAAFYGIFVLAGGLLAVAAGLFTPPAMVLLALYSGLMKTIDVVFEGRLQRAIPSQNRATIGGVKGLASQIGVMSLYMSFGPLAQATSYRAAFLACGGVVAAIGLTYLALGRRSGRAGT
jgi:hypothetical protein